MTIRKTKTAAKSAKKTSVPKMSKSPAALVTTFAQIIECLPQAENRVMFGYPCAFTNGQMFTGLHAERMFVRLSDADREAFMKLPGAHPFEVMPGRPMKEYAVVPAAMVKPGAEIEAWLQRSFTYAQSLPPKAAKAKPSRKRV
ncbi:MAG TPA: TfoX/Sxy family protein [Anaerolineae bacterium]|jgi:TfoX/Sxy family transcriptional regulator of competence genes